MIEMQKRSRRRAGQGNSSARLRFSLPFICVAGVGLVWLTAVLAGWLG